VRSSLRLFGRRSRCSGVGQRVCLLADQGVVGRSFPLSSLALPPICADLVSGSSCCVKVSPSSFSGCLTSFFGFRFSSLRSLFVKQIRFLIVCGSLQVKASVILELPDQTSRFHSFNHFFTVIFRTRSPVVW
jgi:hypothetical protein